MYPKSTKTDIRLTKAAWVMKTRPSLVPKVKEPRVSGPLESNKSDMSVSTSSQPEDSTTPGRREGRDIWHPVSFV